MKHVVLLRFDLQDPDDKAEYEYLQQGKVANWMLSEAYNKVRNRIKHVDGLSEQEYAFLEELRGMLWLEQ